MRKGKGVHEMRLSFQGLVYLLRVSQGISQMNRRKFHTSPYFIEDSRGYHPIRPQVLR